MDSAVEMKSLKKDAGLQKHGGKSEPEQKKYIFLKTYAGPINVKGQSRVIDMQGSTDDTYWDLHICSSTKLNRIPMNPQRPREMQGILTKVRCRTKWVCRD